MPIIIVAPTSEVKLWYLNSKYFRYHLAIIILELKISYNGRNIAIEI